MNKILTYEGGQPVTTQDFDFLQKCYSDVITAFLRGMNNGMDCVLYGIEYGEENPQIIPGHVNPGAVCIGNSIYIIPDSITGTNEKYLCIREVQSEERIFKDSQSHKVYLTHNAYLSNTTDNVYKYVDLTKVKFFSEILSQEVYWEFDEGITIQSDVTGVVEVRRTKNGYERRINIQKRSSADNVLYTYATTRYPVPISCVAVNEINKQAVVLVDVLGTCAMFNMDGTEYKSNATFRNVILK